MTGSSQRQLVIEVERVQTVRRKVPIAAGYCRDCRCPVDLIDVADLARVFEVSVADAVLQLKRRRIHLLDLSASTILVCADSLLMRSDQDFPMLNRSLPPSSGHSHLTISSD